MKNQLLFLFTISILLFSCNKTAQVPTNPTEIQGNWFSTDGYQSFVLGLHNSVLLFDNTVYRNVTTHQNEKHIVITQENGDEILILKKKENQLIVNQENRRITLSKNAKKTKKSKSTVDNSVNEKKKTTIQGFIEGFDSKTDSTGILRVSSVFDHKKYSSLIKIAPDGSFKSEIDLYFPQKAVLFLPRKNQFIYLIPGETSTHFLSSTGLSALHMGSSATINTDIQKFDTIYNELTTEYTSNILAQSQLEYRDTKLKNLDSKIRQLRNHAEKMMIDEHAFQYVVNSQKLRTYRTLLNYPSNYTRAYCEKNNITSERKARDIQNSVKLKNEYVNFIDPQWVQ